ncbi:MAG: molecular chaperone HtpG [Alphaproteobacteria bacterium]|nr:molecular chaperone HtpG [Alphaproteobacteria bacterium]
MSETATIDGSLAQPFQAAQSFQADVSRLLDIVAHALYSDREVFLRELISNASDACDKRRTLALTEHALGVGADYRIRLVPDTAARTLTVTDGGIGMDGEELARNLGTIAHSGTATFLTQLAEAPAETNLIGQFGVGFYAAFMVADRVEVLSRRAGSEIAHRWVSDGRTGFTVEPATRESAGTDITLHLKADAAEFLEKDRLEQVIRKYSDHIAIPIVIVAGEAEETANTASALWTRPKSELTDEALTQFYRHLSPGFDQPFGHLHIRAEGALEFSALLFLPGAKPFDLFSPERRHGVKLYVRRVFITDGCEGLIPSWLRFVRGVVDSADLPLAVSREMLQGNPMIGRIATAITKRVLAEIDKRSTEEGYTAFWENFGAVLKEGLYEGFEHREVLLKLARFRSTTRDGWVSLADYKAAMKPGQTAIYTISGDDAEKLKASPQLEAFRAKGVEVLLLTDPIDEFWPVTVGTYDGTSFQSVTRGQADLSGVEGGTTPAVDEAAQAALDPLLAALQLALRDQVKAVRASTRLTDSAVCLVADAGDMDIRLEKLLRQHRQMDQATKRVLEVNPTHPLILALSKQQAAGGDVEDAAFLLLDQARIVEGEAVADPAAFVRRLNAALARGLAGA